jgi:hypothetical protein
VRRRAAATRRERRHDGDYDQRERDE